MQKLAFILASAVLLTACGSSKKAGTSVPSRDNVKGNWQVTDIKYSGVATGENLSFTLLDEGSESCVVGSTWILPNNGKGTYIINGSGNGCVQGERPIVWSYRKDGGEAYFQYKRVEGGVKPKDVTEGYRFRIASADGSTLVLESNIVYEGRPLVIIYTLQKT